MKFRGIQEIVFNSIKECDVDICKDFYPERMQSGSTTRYPDVAGGMQIPGLAPRTMRSEVMAPPESKHSVWMGGSILAPLPSFLQTCVSQQDYAESGFSIVHRRGF